ncbi:MAG: AAA family ATPase, partial [Armatimonadetes bacterium]|nr:AAA family ATPase [Armatimonadota bacterium]
MKSPLTIELLGGLAVRSDDEVVARFRTQKTAVLLAYLATYLHRQHAREELVDLLWPDADLDAGRTSLRTALASLRKQLEPPGTPEGRILMADRLHVQLNPEAVTTDLLTLERASKTAANAADPAERIASLIHAAEQYRGHLLPGFYEDWTLRERERYQSLYVELLRELVSELERSGDFSRALDYAQRIVAVDPLIEEAHADLLRLYAATGQYSAMTRQYRELERVLRQNLGSPPSERTQALYDRLLKERGEAQDRRPAASPSSTPPAEAASPVPPPASLPDAASEITGHAENTGAAPEPAAPPPKPEPPAARLPQQLTRFIGREGELAQLERLLQPGETRLFTLTGPGGTGKTRLALEAAHRLADAYGGTVWFVSLSELPETSETVAVADALARAMQLMLTPEGDPLDAIIERLSRGPSLLVLDNFEHLIEAGTPVLMKLLTRTPALTCLVTSRQRLDIGVEHQFPVPPLPIPEVPGGP